MGANAEATQMPCALRGAVCGKDPKNVGRRLDCPKLAGVPPAGRRFTSSRFRLADLDKLAQ